MLVGNDYLWVMKLLPLGIQDFEILRTGDHLYVDKTKYILPLLEGRKTLFFSRPRRFGKSLLLSTLNYLFRGRRDLFEGLYIYDKIDWEEYPVIRLDFSGLDYASGIEAFSAAIQESLVEQAESYGLPIRGTYSLMGMFRALIKDLYEKFGCGVVLLVDEYDKPVVDLWEEEKDSSANQQLLANLFGMLKRLDEYLRFVLFTGITKVAKLSVFSKLNNIVDISLHPDYNSLIGITQVELEANFADYFPLLEANLGLPREELLEELRLWYNGYNWTGKEKVYNPYGLLQVMWKKRFFRYWFASGTPNFLIKRMRNKPIDLVDFERIKTSTLEEQEADWRETPLETLLFQTGYLTIVDYEFHSFGETYVLSYPNNEVRLAFMNKLLKVFGKNEVESMYTVVRRLKGALDTEDMEAFLGILKGFYASIPYSLHVKAERFYHALFLAFMRMLGMDVEGEILTDVGRIDSVLKRSHQIYIIEFKYSAEGGSLDRLVNKALAQIRSKGYGEKYAGDERRLLYMGIAFDGVQISGRLEEGN